jgi:hypothetical protein
MPPELTGPSPKDPRERIRFLAQRSVARGTGFAGLAVFTLTVGFAFSPVAAALAGTIGAAAVTAVLAWKAHTSLTRPYKETEVWVMLDRQPGIPERLLQKVIGEELRSCYWRFARYAGAATLGMWLISIALRLGGLGVATTI